MTIADLSQLTILIVDGDPRIRQLTAQMLAMAGVCRIHRVATATNALTVLDRQRVDLVITEWTLEPFTGPDLIRAIRTARHPRLAALPVIMLTADTDVVCVRAALRAGVSHILVKPTSIAKLTGSIEAVLRRAWLAAQASEWGRIGKDIDASAPFHHDSHARPR